MTESSLRPYISSEELIARNALRLAKPQAKREIADLILSLIQ